MKKLALGALFVGLMAACGGGKDPIVVPPDNNGGGDGTVGVCNPIAQTGCLDTEKCTWIDDSDNPPVGHIGCVALTGDEVGLAETCMAGPAGPQGFDNCQKGLICVAAECKTICDPQMAGVASGCDAQHSCSRYSGLFEVGGMITAGACDPQCDPLNQNLLAGTGNTAACGSPDPAVPNKGCYTFDFNAFSCAPVSADTLPLTDREPPVTNSAGNPFVNGCAPGYVPLFFESSANQETRCTGLCASANISSDPAEVGNAQGLATAMAKLVDKAAPAVGDGLCVAGKKGSASGGPQNCVMMWPFLVDANGNPGTSQYQETVGFCFSFGQFVFDDDNDPMTPDVQFPDCKDKPKRDQGGPNRDQPTPLQTDDAADFGCQVIAESMLDNKPQAPMMKDFRLPIDGALKHR